MALRITVAPEKSSTPSAQLRLRESRLQRLRRDPRLAGILLATLAGLIARLVPAAASGFPLDDGGMFYVMTRDLQANHYVLPATTTYNGLHLPFAYSPLSFYLAGFVSGCFHISLLHVFQFMPAVVSILTIPAAYLLFRAMLKSEAAAIIAAFAFALMPAGFRWTIAGGGITRSVGFFFAILAIHQAYRALVDRQQNGVALAALFIALAALSHVETGLFAATTTLTFAVCYAHDRRGLLALALMGIGALILSSPWWVAVLAMHGPAPFLHAGGTGAFSAAALLSPLWFAQWSFTGERLFPVFSVLALIGLIRCVRTRRFFLAAWPFIVFFFDSRAGITYIMPSIAILAGIGFIEVALPLVGAPIVSAASELWNSRRARLAFYGTVVYAVLAGLVAGMPSAGIADSASTAHALSASQRNVFRWVTSNVPPGANFIVIGGEEHWWQELTAEWFPALTGHPSLATVQGSEWLGQTEFRDRIRAATDLQKCAGRDAACLDHWLTDQQLSPEYIYVSAVRYTSFAGDPDPCCGSLRESLAHDPAYHLVFENSGGSIFKVEERKTANAR